MAETAVGLLVDRLVPLLTEEARLLTGVKTEVDSIKHELQSIMAFLKDADRIADSEGDYSRDGVKVWVEELRDTSFDIEVVIDEYTELMARKQSRRDRNSLFVEFLRKVSCFVGDLKSRHKIVSKVQELKQTVRYISERREKYGLSAESAAAGSSSFRKVNSHDPRKEACFLEEDEVVGLESDRDKVVGFLNDGSPSRMVVSVVAMGGFGKSTLAHLVYDREKVKYDCHAWVDVTRSYDTVERLRDLMEKFCKKRKKTLPEGLDRMDEKTVTKVVRDYLQGKSYFVVFDDVWDKTFWAKVKDALPDSNEKKARVMITTRLMDVAWSCQETARVEFCKLHPLTQDKALELFCKRAFLKFEGRCPEELKELSGEIVEKCEGMPLAIVVVAGLLSTKNSTVEEWKKLCTTMSSELESNERLTSITKVLSLSYNDLPHYLKSCFLYFGIFPKPNSIPYKRLTREWIAEGFVSAKKDKSVEFVAEEYLSELINRSMVQVLKVNLDGKVKKCRIHDLLHDFILIKMEDLSFCRVINGSNKSGNFKGKARRLSIHESPGDSLKDCSEISYARSFFVFDDDQTSVNSLANTVPKRFKLLKVLDFEDAPTLDRLPKDIGRLFHLRYLSLRGTKVEILPKSIGKLENLENLDLKKTLVRELPAEINMLKKLQNLLANCDVKEADSYDINRRRGVRVKKGIGQLKALQKLAFIEANSDHGVNIFNELSQLTKLRKLGIKMVRSEDGEKLCSCIQKMTKLETLEVGSVDGDETIELVSEPPMPESIRLLNLKGPLRKLPEWIPGLQNLTRLRILWSKLADDPIKAFQGLHNLLELGISYDAYSGKKLLFEKGSFPKLKVLELRCLNSLESLEIEEGAFCDLEKFWIGPCPKLKNVVLGFRGLTTLEIVRFDKMPTHFLMFQNFETLQSAQKVEFVYEIGGQITYFHFNWVLYLQRHVPDPEKDKWASLEFEQLFRKVEEIIKKSQNE